jgi:hypothetical protein
MSVARNGLDRSQPLPRAGIDTRLVGDCVAPRNLLCAIHESEASATGI